MRLLVGYDGRASSRDALALATLLRQVEDVELVLGVVLPPVPPHPGFRPREEALRRESGGLLARASADVEALDPALRVEHRVIGDRSPVRGLRDLALSEGADLVVLGSTDRGAVGRILPGTVATD